MGQLWYIRKRVIGGKKSKIMATAIRNPKTGKLIVGKRDIKETTLNYCIDTLTNNPIEKGFEKYINQKKEKVEIILEMNDGSFETQKENF